MAGQDHLHDLIEMGTRPICWKKGTQLKPVRSYWLAVTFIAGIALGAIVARQSTNSTDAAAPAGEAPRPAPPASSDMPIRPDVSSAPKTAAQPPALQANAPSRSAPAETTAAPTTAAAAPTAAAPGGIELTVDVGPVFREQFTEAATHGVKNTLLEAHLALERETRNDSWAYSTEAQLQNALVADTSMGNFKLEHLECRATMCEVRLSGRGSDQSTALGHWNDGVRTLDWGTPLYPSTSSFVGRNDDADVLIILTARPKQP
jgi:hypothetical protein